MFYATIASALLNLFLLYHVASLYKTIGEHEGAAKQAAQIVADTRVSLTQFVADYNQCVADKQTDSVLTDLLTAHAEEQKRLLLTQTASTKHELRTLARGITDECKDRPVPPELVDAAVRMR